MRKLLTGFRRRQTGSLRRLLGCAFGATSLLTALLVLGAGTPASASFTTATGVAVSAQEGTTSSNVKVATFTSPDDGPFTAMIDWGDGSSSAGTISGGPSPAAFSVAGTHTYVDEGNFTVSTQITDTSDSTTETPTSTATVAEGDFGSLTPASISAIEGTALNGVTVGSFSDQGNPSQVAGDWTATIDWGDGTATSTGTVSGPTGGPFTVTGDHTYTEDEASGVPVTVTVKDDSPSTLSFAIDSTATIAEGDVIGATTPAALSGTEGTAMTGVTVGSFTDTGNPFQVAGDWTATIDWGDGTATSTGTVSGPTGGPFTVTGSHTYTDETSGTIPVTVTVSDDSPGTLIFNIDSTATVAEADSGSITTVALSATEGTALTGVTVGSYTDTGNSSQVAGDWTATINWGDGTATSTGTVSGPTGGPFTVTGSHTYTDETSGTIPVTVTVKDDPPSTLSFPINSTATVAEGDALTGTGSAVSAAPSVSTGSVQTASFTDTNPSAAPADFTTTIKWGDGTTTAGTISGPTGGPFAVTGTHTYATAGSYTVTTTITDDSPGTATASAVSAATVPNPPTVTITTPVAGAIYGQGAVVDSAFSCSDGTLGPGIAHCVDQNGNPSGSLLDTTTPGTHTLAVTATSSDGQTHSTSVTYDVLAFTASCSARVPSGQTAVGAAPTADDLGYWIVTNRGAVITCGDARSFGQLTGGSNAPVVGIAATTDGNGYYLVGADGGVFTFGDATYEGSMASSRLSQPVVGMALDSATGGYWLVAADGGVFAFDAPFNGSMGGTRLDKPVVGMATDRATGGYWLVASDGGVFALHAPFQGSMGGKPLNDPVIGMAADPATGGYWLAASDGGLFAFDVPYYGSMGGVSLNKPVAGVESAPTGTGYRLLGSDGGVFSFGQSPFEGSGA